MTNKELEKEVKRQKVLIDCSAKLIQLQKNHIAELEKLLADNHIYKKHYSKGVTVHNANETCRTLDIVLSGSLVAYSLSTNGS